MSVAFESILTQAEKLSKKERAKLIDILSAHPLKEKKLKHSVSNENGTDDAEWIAALRARIDKIIKHENPKPNSSAQIAERIRKMNDRGYKL